MRIDLEGTLLTVTLIGLITAGATAQQEAPEHRDLARMKALAGDWASVEEDGTVTGEAFVTYRVTSAGSTVVETLMPGTEHEMVTVYTVDHGDLILTHYCALANQPRMRAKGPGADDHIFLDCDGGTGMESEADMHMHSLKLSFLGPDHIKHEWTTHSGGKSIGGEVFELQRMGVTPTTSPSMVDDSGHALFGAGVHLGETIPVADALAAPEKIAGKTVRIEGPVVSVCQKKGCWMRLGDADRDMLVRFQDYGFFVPLDTEAGATAIIEGVLSIDEQSVEEQRHYLEDAGKHEEAMKITEPAKVVGFLATGVAIER